MHLCVVPRVPGRAGTGLGTCRGGSLRRASAGVSTGVGLTPHETLSAAVSPRQNGGARLSKRGIPRRSPSASVPVRALVRPQERALEDESPFQFTKIILWDTGSRPRMRMDLMVLLWSLGTSRYSAELRTDWWR